MTSVVCMLVVLCCAVLAINAAESTIDVKNVVDMTCQRGMKIADRVCAYYCLKNEQKLGSCETSTAANSDGNETPRRACRCTFELPMLAP